MSLKKLYLVPLLILFFIFTYYLIRNFSDNKIYIENSESSSSEIKLDDTKNVSPLIVEVIYEDLLLIKEGQTFGQILNNYEISNSVKSKILESLNSKVDLSKLNINTEIRITFTKENDLTEIKKISVLDKKNNHIKVIKKDDNYVVETSSILSFTKHVLKEVTIKDSLYKSAIEANIPPNIIMQFVNLYAFDVDFQREIRNGNKIKIFCSIESNFTRRTIDNINIDFIIR